MVAAQPIGRWGPALRGPMPSAMAWPPAHCTAAPPPSPPCLLQYDAKLCELLDTHTKLFLVHADNVGSKQFMDIRAVRARERQAGERG